MSSTWKMTYCQLRKDANARKMPSWNWDEGKRFTDLFDGFGRQHNGTVVSDTDAVLDADSDSSKLLRPPLVVGNIDTT